MTKKQIEYVLAVARFGSITMAAKALYISQPSLSEQINAVEKEIGFKLFDRTRKRVVLSEAGQEMIRCFSDFISAYEEAYTKGIEIAKGLSGTVYIGILGMTDCTEIFTKVNEFTRKEPGRRDWIFNGHWHELMEMVRSGRLDILFMFDDLVEQDPQLEIGRVYESEFVLVYSALDPDLQKETVSPSDLDGKPYFYAEEHDQCKKTMEYHRKVFSELGMHYGKNARIVPSVATVYDRVLSENGYAICSEHSSILNQSRYRYIKTGIKHNLCAVWKKDSISPLARNMLQSVFNIDL